MIPGEQGGPPPGWYADPWAMATWRWWDGSSWTADLANPPGAPGPTWPGAPGPTWPLAPGLARSPFVAGGQSSGWAGGPALLSAHESLTQELRFAPWARRAFAGFVVVFALHLAANWSEATWFRQLSHTIRVDFDTGRTHRGPTLSGTTHTLIWLSLLLEVAVFVSVLLWQFRAARTARLLGLPASLSPGLGVGGWFIPVVNFWFPYLALRDCLPPGDEGRRLVVRLWASYVTTLVASWATLISFVVWPGGSWLFAAVELVAAASIGWHGVAASRRIGEVHGELLGGGRPELAIA